MSEDFRKDYIVYRIKKSKESYAAAILLAEHKQWNGCVNRLYYACFYIITALLSKHLITAKTHTGVRAQFGLHFIKKGTVPKEYGEIYATLLDWRNKGDYSDFFEFEEDSVKPMISAVEVFIQIIEARIASSDIS